MARASVPLEWVHAPQQARSQRTLEKLLDAAERILLERGLDAVTVPEVVREAGSSVGSFYARFPDKRALLETLHERACVQSLDNAELLLEKGRWSQASLESLVSASVRFAVHVFGSRRNIMNAFTQAFAGDPGFSARRARTAVAIQAKLVEVFLEKRGSMTHPEPEAAITMALRVVTATLEQRNAFSMSGLAAVEIADEELVRELERMMLGYLAG